VVAALLGGHIRLPMATTPSWHFYEMSTSETISGLQSQAVRFRACPSARWGVDWFDTVKGNALIQCRLTRTRWS
jgi:hypothetical protein